MVNYYAYWRICKGHINVLNKRNKYTLQNDRKYYKYTFANGQ